MSGGRSRRSRGPAKFARTKRLPTKPSRSSPYALSSDRARDGTTGARDFRDSRNEKHFRVRKTTPLQPRRRFPRTRPNANGFVHVRVLNTTGRTQLRLVNNSRIRQAAVNAVHVLFIRAQHAVYRYCNDSRSNVGVHVVRTRDKKDFLVPFASDYFSSRLFIFFFFDERHCRGRGRKRVGSVFGAHCLGSVVIWRDDFWIRALFKDPPTTSRYCTRFLNRTTCAKPNGKNRRIFFFFVHANAKTIVGLATARTSESSSRGEQCSQHEQIGNYKK